MAAPAPGVLVIGAGLAGSLLALELRQRGAAVTLLEAGDGATASAISYGGVPGWAVASTPLARQAAGAARQWRRLQQRHGDLGWRRCGLRLHGSTLSPLVRWLPCSRVDTARFTERLPAVLAAAGVALQRGVADRLSREGALWRVDLAGGAALTAATVVLAAGAGCRRLWPDLPPQWRLSWAGLLELPQPQGNRITPDADKVEALSEGRDTTSGTWFVVARPQGALPLPCEASSCQRVAVRWDLELRLKPGQVHSGNIHRPEEWLWRQEWLMRVR